MANKYSWPNWDQRKSLDNRGPDNRGSTVYIYIWCEYTKFMYFKYGFHVLTLWIHQASQQSGFKCPSGCSADTYSHHVFTGHWLGFKLTTARIIHWKPVNYYSKFFITFFITFVRTESRRQILLTFQRKNSCQHSRYRNIFCSTWFLKRVKPITEKKSMLISCHSTK